MKKTITSIAACLLICIAAKAQQILDNNSADDKDKSTCVSGNCKNGIGTLEFSHPDGPATYKGNFKDGKFNGQGTLVVKASFKYAGSFKDGEMNGRGVYTFASGEVYTGEMKKGVIEGSGSSVLPNGKKFTGTYSKGHVVNGKGYLFYTSDSTSYEGSLVNGKFNGIGTWTLVHGEKFSGNWVDGELNGIGKYTSPDGSKYNGNFKDSKMDGYGVATDELGWVYKGNWANGMRNGTGSSYDPKGNLNYSGEWSNGEMTNPEKAASYKNSLWETARLMFSRVTFKGWQKVVTDEISGAVGITDEFHLNSDYSFYGTDEYIIDYLGQKYRTKQKIEGTFDPVTHMIHISPRDVIYHDKIEGVTWMRGACDGILYPSNSHPGHYIIKGKSMSGSDFEENDY